MQIKVTRKIFAKLIFCQRWAFTVFWWDCARYLEIFYLYFSVRSLAPHLKHCKCNKILLQISPVTLLLFPWPEGIVLVKLYKHQKFRSSITSSDKFQNSVSTTIRYIVNAIYKGKVPILTQFCYSSGKSL